MRGAVVVADFERLKWALLDELVTTAALSIVTTSVLNAAMSGINVDAVFNEHLPPAPIVFPRVHSGQIVFASVDLEAIVRFYNMLARARTGLQISVAASDLRVARMAFGMDAGARAWRDVAAASIPAIRRVGKWHTPDRAERCTQMTELAHLAEAAAEGWTPCLVDGCPVVPFWARRYSRKSANLAAILESAGSKQRVVIGDASRGGCGIRRSRSLPLGATVQLRLESGRILSGTLQWQAPPLAGIKFLRELSPTDPLICGG